jgi:hypothetical protein
MHSISIIFSMGSHQTLAEQAQLQSQLFRQCQQRNLYQQALIRTRDSRNEGNSLLSSAIGNPRFHLPFTQHQLDMRRKAEILQYAGPSTQGGKRENKVAQWSRLNKRFGNFSLYTASFDLSCTSLTYNRPTSTTESNVPGPPQMLVFDPQVTLYNFTGMRQDMKQVSVVPAAPLPPYNHVPFSTNISVVKYKSGSYNEVEVSFSPLNVTAITYFNVAMKSPPLQCSLTFRLDATVSLVLLDPTLAAFSSRVPVDSLQLFINGIQPAIYLMTEPQIYGSDFLLSVVKLATNFACTFPKLQMPKNSLQQYVYGSLTHTFNIAPANSHLQFAVTGDASAAVEIVQQTDRIALDVQFDLLAYDIYGADINPALAINMDQLSIQFQLTPTNVTLLLA